MKSFLVRSGLLVGLLIAITVPLWNTSDDSSASEPTTITNYQGDFTVSATGQLTAIETITVDFPQGAGRHGIFRFFDTWAGTGHRPPMVPHDIAVAQDGRPATTEISWDHRHQFRTVKIGDADRYVTPGEHVYRISYRLDDVLTKGTGGLPTQLTYDVIPAGWRQPIEHAELSVHLPAPAKTALLRSKATDVQIAGENTPTLLITTGALQPNTGVALRSGLDIATPSQPATTPWTTEWRRVLGSSLAVLVIVVLLALAAGLAGWWVTRSTREQRPGYPLQYAPPEGIGPAQAYYVLNEVPSKNGYIASLMYAAEKGVVRLEVGEGRQWTVKRNRSGTGQLDDVTAVTVDRLLSKESEFSVGPKDTAAGEKLKDEMGSLDQRLATWGLASKLLARSGPRVFTWLLPIAFVLLVVNIFLNPFRMSALDLIPGLLIVFGIGVLAPAARTRRTPEGRDMWSRVGGFERILSTPSSEQRFDFASKKDLYAAYLPWAVVFGCADAWAEKYRVETGSEPPVPSFFTGYALGSMASIGSLTDSFSSSLSSAVSAYNATQHSSSSGGGFSGGSFGGGGGGSW